jgi:hypothetical protein
MLDETDVHYLAGILTKASSPDSVEIELGSMVEDSAAKKKRDVDITVTKRNPDGSLEAFSGIEVKAEKRPLDVIHVEQLAGKLNDMPGLHRRAVVSASGYTGPSKLKAAAHGLELWNLRDWNPSDASFGHIRFSERFPYRMMEPYLEWAENPHVSIEPSAAFTNEEREELTGLLPARFAGRLAEQASAGVWQEKKDDLILDSPVPVTVDLSLNDEPKFVGKEREYIIRTARVRGRLILRQSEQPGLFKVLSREGENIAYAACCVSVSRAGHLVALIFSNTNRDVRIALVPLADRLKKKIRGQRLM